MWAGSKLVGTFLVYLLLSLFNVFATGQTQTSGRIAGIVRDAQGAVVAGAEVVVDNLAIADKRSVKSDVSGNYSVPLLPPAIYDLRIEARGFTPAVFHGTPVGLNETVTVNATLQVAQGSFQVNVTEAPPMVRTDSSELNTTLNSPSLTQLPLPTRNFLQLLTLAPGMSAPLTNNNAIGRNSPNVSVNGSRVTQNNYQINGIYANDISLHVLADVGVPAPESVSEVNVQTSMYDASVAGAGGSVQLATKSGSNQVHGSVYEYFRNEALNANDANLRAVSEQRPVMRRNVYGVTMGGPIRKNRAFFFSSYQGTREANGATDQSLYKSVLIAPGLTDDRSATILMNTFNVASVDPISLQMLNLKLPNGRFLIPTPQTSSGRVTGSALSTYHEEQFNANLDDHLGARDSLSGKFFFAHAPLFSALAGSNFGVPASLPGFGTLVNVDNRVLSVQEIHTFNPTAVNESRFGYSILRHDEVPQESVEDASLGIQRSTAAEYPGLPLIVLGRDQGGASIGTSDITYRGTTRSLSFADLFSLQRRRHSLRLGGEIMRAEWRARAGVYSYGEIDFPTFEDFLTGNTGASQLPDATVGFAHLGTGLTHRDSRTTDYHLFIEDDWRVSSRFSINLGLRYEMDPPPFDSQGRIGGFDPGLYVPPSQLDSSGFPVGPPAAGLFEAGNALPQYGLPGVTRVGKRVIKSIDPNNLGPRVGFAWSPSESGRLALRAGYGIFFARPSFFYLALQYFNPPFFLDSETSGQPFNTPFATAPSESSFPLVRPGTTISGWSIDRDARTPYMQQFNASLQYELPHDTTLQIAYAGSRGVKLFRSVAVNQAAIASLSHPITNAVTGQVITDNTIENTALRAPMQGVSTASFVLNESTAQSTYHSFQMTLSRRFSHGLQFSASYTFSRSIDNASNPGGGANTDGSLDRSGGLDTANVWGNQLAPRANRGMSDFDRTHYFVFAGIWDVPSPSFVHVWRAGRLLFSNWQLSGIVTAMSGLPVDVFDPTGGLLYGLLGARPSWAPRANRRTALNNVPAGYYFNPTAFVQAWVQSGQPIPSAHDATALAPEGGTDIGDVGRNVLRGPSQSNIDFSVGRRFVLAESKDLQFRADFFNLLNHANRDNPISDISTGDFGRIVSFSSSPRIVQLSLKFTF
jgi:hypothetical protein